MCVLTIVLPELIILCTYVSCSYVLVIKKGYLKCEDGETVSTTKVDGIAYTNSSLFNIPPLDNQYSDRVWDTADYVIPPEVIITFIMFNLILQQLMFSVKCMNIH